MTATARFSEGAPQPVLVRMWWALLLKAVAAVLFAVLAFFWLGGSTATLASLFTIYAAVDGILSMIGASRGGGLSERAGLALAGMVSLLAGAAAGLMPDMTSANLATIIGVWAVLRGGLEFAAALKLRKYLERDWSLALVGMMSVLFGAMLIAYPAFEPRMLVRLLSGYSLILGLLLAILAIRFRRGLRP